MLEEKIATLRIDDDIDSEDDSRILQDLIQPRRDLSYTVEVSLVKFPSEDPLILLSSSRK